MPGFNIDPIAVVVFLTTLGSFAAALSFGLPLAKRYQQSTRMKILHRRREDLRRQQKENLEQKTLRDQFSKKSLAVRLVTLMRIGRLAEMQGLKTRLMMAGWRDKSAASVFIFSHVFTPAFLVIPIALIVYQSDKVDMEPSQSLMCVLGAAILGLLLPSILLKNKILKRQEALARIFPDMLDLLLICVQAGLSLEGAFNRVTEEIGVQSVEIAEELGQTAAELAFLGDRRQAFENMAMRTGMANFKSLATALIQSERYGTPVGVALKILSEESRTKRGMDIEKKAGALPAKLTVPMILFFLPVLLVVIIGPAIIQLTSL